MSVPKVSLICATLNRTSELSKLLDSLQKQTFRDFELILVDQNPPGTLDPLLKGFGDLPVVHLRSAKGLSLSRNAGIRVARGEILGFPDDDSWYYPDTIQKVVSCFDQGEFDFVLGRIFDREVGRPVLKRFPSERRLVNRWNFYRLTTSITLFCKKGDLSFDESLGAGARFGSCEDVDFVYELVRCGALGAYEPAIELMHPDQVLHEFSPAKIRAYGEGFGAFCRKRLDFPKAVLFSLSLAQGVALVAGTLLSRPSAAVRRATSLRSRIRGFLTQSEG